MLVVLDRCYFYFEKGPAHVVQVDLNLSPPASPY